MAFDSLSPVAPTRVRCLLVPRGPITQADFLRFKQMLELESIIRLGDVSPSDGLGNSRSTISKLDSAEADGARSLFSAGFPVRERLLQYMRC